MLIVVAFVLFVGGAFCISTVRLRWAGVPPWRRSRTVPRRRWHVSRRGYALALRCGFRYSYTRDALVLRLVGRRWGPVLKLGRPGVSGAGAGRGPISVGGSAAPAGGGSGGTVGAFGADGFAGAPAGSGGTAGDAGAPAGLGSAGLTGAATGVAGMSARVGAAGVGGDAAAGRADDAASVQSASERLAAVASSQSDELLATGGRPGLGRVSRRADRVIDVACQPLPHVHRMQRLWQLTAVDVEVRYVWVELKRTRGEPPPPQDAAGFIRRIAADLEALGLRLDAIVVRSDGAPRRPVFDAAVTGGVRLLRVPPGTRHERVATQLHERIAATYWRKTFAEDPGRSMGALRRGLRSWVEAHNEAPPAHDVAALSPAAALRAQANPLIVVSRSPEPGGETG